MPGRCEVRIPVPVEEAHGPGFQPREQIDEKQLFPLAKKPQHVLVMFPRGRPAELLRRRNRGDDQAASVRKAERGSPAEVRNGYASPARSSGSHHGAWSRTIG